VVDLPPSHKAHRRFPEILAFTLSSPVRRLFNPPEQLVRKLELKATDVVIDFGCGTGFFTIPIAKLAGRTIGTDISSSMLEKATSYAKRSCVTVEFVRSDGTEVRLEDRSVDVILLVHVFHEVENRIMVLGEFSRILRLSGRLIIVENTHGGLFSGRFGPPIIDKMDVIQDVERGGFACVETIPHRNDSIIICQKKA
jgi:SAM-dependent methyltransferase